MPMAAPVRVRTKMSLTKVSCFFVLSVLCCPYLGWTAAYVADEHDGAERLTMVVTSSEKWFTLHSNDRIPAKLRLEFISEEGVRLTFHDLKMLSRNSGCENYIIVDRPDEPFKQDICNVADVKEKHVHRYRKDGRLLLIVSSSNPRWTELNGTVFNISYVAEAETSRPVASGLKAASPPSTGEPNRYDMVDDFRKETTYSRYLNPNDSFSVECPEGSQCCLESVGYATELGSTCSSPCPYLKPDGLFNQVTTGTNTAYCFIGFAKFMTGSFDVNNYSCRTIELVVQATENDTEVPTSFSSHPTDTSTLTGGGIAGIVVVVILLTGVVVVTCICVRRRCRRRTPDKRNKGEEDGEELNPAAGGPIFSS